MFTSSFLLLALAAEPAGNELFRIERSKNANVVVYEAKPGAKTALDVSEPVTASWLLLAKKGQRESLSFFEKLLAYGFEVRVAEDGASAVLKLKALKGRTLRVVQRGARLAAVGMIDGADAVLERVFVTTDEGGAVPKVKSIELFGVDAVSGAPRSERIVAGK
jgi:hypothetical protein